MIETDVRYFSLLFWTSFIIRQKYLFSFIMIVMLMMFCTTRGLIRSLMIQHIVFCSVYLYML